jgi:putative phosphoesterase
MRVAALYDIHGNLPALDAVLEEVDRLDIDVLVIGGDLAWGPLPAETLDRLQSIDRVTHFIRGNADREVAARADESDGLDKVTAEVNVWAHDQLSTGQRTFLAGLPETVELDVSGLGSVLFCHGSPRRDDESITIATPKDAVLEMLADVESNIVVCGHTHAQFERVVGQHRVVNAGSVGLPFGEAGGYWLLLDPDVQLKRTPYDTQVAAAVFRRKGGPAAADFADHVIAPPPAETAAEVFG